jgi:bile acid:Na+ symporter, BASS family
MRAPLVEAARAAAAIYLIIMMVSMGLELGGRAPGSKAAKRRRRRLLLRGLAFNLLLLPLFAVLLTRGIHASGDVTVAFLLLAAAPGGRFAPHLARVAGAELGLSVEITLFLAKLVAFTAPLTARLMLQCRRPDISVEK